MSHHLATHICSNYYYYKMTIKVYKFNILNYIWHLCHLTWGGIKTFLTPRFSISVPHILSNTMPDNYKGIKFEPTLKCICMKTGSFLTNCDVFCAGYNYFATNLAPLAGVVILCTEQIKYARKEFHVGLKGTDVATDLWPI